MNVVFCSYFLSVSSRSEVLVDSILFPAPPCEYDTSVPGLFWIPRDLSQGKSDSIYDKLNQSSFAVDRENSIPCIFHPADILPHPNAHRHFQFPGQPDQTISNASFDLAAFSGLYLIYCHANATDMGQMEPELTIYCKFFNVNIISMEYPGNLHCFFS
jgi:hypothetical protein